VIPRRADLFLFIMEAVVMEALGEDGFARLVAAFYRRVRVDDLIGPMYPPDDWENAERRLADFLIFRFGGSDRYIQERGHPRLRMRHVPFSIGEAERDRWLELMGAAMDELGLAGEARVNLGAFFDQVADFMRNREG
jgi:hemoglobin